MTAHSFIPPQYQAFPATPDDRRWMDLVVDELRRWSKHSGTKHGSVITGPDGEFRALGYNGLPRGEDDANPAFHEHPLKRQKTMCAERNALRNLILTGGTPTGCTLHADAIPCTACAREIVAAGIKTVVMVDAQVPSTAHQDNFWQDGLEILLANGVEIRHHDPANKKYEAATRKEYHDPIPSGTVDWDSRFLALASYLEGWGNGNATGEVLAFRPSAPGQVYDKVVRSLGIWTPSGPDSGEAYPDALRTARHSGISPQGCTLFLSRPDPLADPARLVASGISGVVLSDEFAKTRTLIHSKARLEEAGLQVYVHHPAPQDFTSLVELYASASSNRTVFQRPAP